MNQSAIISAMGHYLPGEPIPNQVIEDRVKENSTGFILPRGILKRLTGVSHRHHAVDEVSSDMAAKAGLKALENARLLPSDIDFMIFASASHDVAEPATANIVQEKIGCTNAHVVDVKNACNSFVNALDIAHSFITTGRAKCILITSGEVISPFIKWKITGRRDAEKKIAGLTLGDGGAACVVMPSDDTSRGIFPGKFFTDGSQWRLSTIMGGGSLMKHDYSELFFESDSPKLLRLAADIIPTMIMKGVDDMGWDLQKDLKLIVPHQVSIKIIQKIFKMINLPLDRCMITINKFGNTAAASIPIALSLAMEQGRILQGEKLLLVGGAAGFSVAVTPIVL